MRFFNQLAGGIIIATYCLSASCLTAAELAHIGLATTDVLCVELIDGRAVHAADGSFGRLEGASVRRNALANSSAYRISGGEYGKGKSPLRVGYKSKGSEFVKAGEWKFTPRYTHWLYLKLPSPLEPGTEYRLSIDASLTGAEAISADFVFDPLQLRSESIHLSQIGFVPEAPKFGFLSCWAGTMGPLSMSDAAANGFTIVDSEGKEVHKGTISLRRSAEATGDDAYKNNYQKCDTYEFDFSSLKKPGQYKAVIPGIGCSFQFVVSPKAFLNAYRISVRGLYYQRCGCELKAQHAGKKWARPVCHHPRHGKKVEETTLKLTETQMGGGGVNQFQELPKRSTGKSLDFWGGWHDAGDFDRRVGHLTPAAQLLDVYSIFPERFKDGDLKIPESGNGIPDIIDEALWCIDFFIRGQRDDGAVRGGIESENHPPHDCYSPNDPLHLYAYAPDAYSSYRLAWCAAKAARILSQTKGRSRAKGYLDAAVKAWNWAIENDNGKYRDEKNAAAAELYAASGKENYHDSFRESSVWTSNPNSATEQHNKFDQRQGAFSYGFAVSESKADAKLRNSIRQALIKIGDDRVNVAGKRTFRFAASYWRPMNWGLGASPDVRELIWAYAVTKDKKYADAIATTCAFTLGGNPLNLVWVSGLGEKHVTQILHHDAWYQTRGDDKYASFPGMVPSGPVRFKEASKGIHGFTQRSFEPQMKDWPPLEQYAGNRYDPGMNEHTPVSIGSAAQAYAFIYAWGLGQ